MNHVELKYALEEMSMEDKFTSKMKNGKAPQYSAAQVEMLMNQWRDTQLAHHDDDGSDSEF